MADLPDVVKTFRLIGRLGRGAGDTIDAGTTPDLIPLAGARIICTPDLAVPVFKAPTAVPPVTIFQETIVGTTNANGELVAGTLSADGKSILPLPNAQVGIDLPWGGSPDIQPNGWTWTVYISVGGNFPDRKFTVGGSDGGTFDISTLIPVPAQPGEELIAWQQAVATTLGYRDSAAASASTAKSWSDKLGQMSTDLTTGRLSTLSKRIANTNLNNLKETGFYFGWNMANGPAGTSNDLHILVMAHQDDSNTAAGIRVLQKVTIHDGSRAGQSFFRTFRDGAWGGWIQNGDAQGALDFTARAQKLDGTTVQTTTAFDELPSFSKWVIPGIYQSQVSDTGWPSRYAFLTTMITNVNRGMQIVADKESGAIFTRVATGSTTWSPLLRMTDQGVLDAATADLKNAGRLGPTSKDISSTDLNALVANGMYRGKTLTNAPGGITSEWFYVLVQSHDTTAYTSQIAIQYTAGSNGSIGDVYMRQRNQSTWSSWTKIAETSGAVDATARILGNGAVPMSAAVASQVHVKNASGTEVGIAYGSAVANSAMVQRDGSGQVAVPTSPSADDRAASKLYVDNRAGDKAPADNAAAATTATLDGTASKAVRRLLQGNVTLSFSGAPSASQSFSNLVVLVQDGTGGRTVTWPSSVKWAGGTKPTLSTAANAIDVIRLTWTGVEWIGTVEGLNFA